jgi:hypothetical protein
MMHPSLQETSFVGSQTNLRVLYVGFSHICYLAFLLLRER